MILCSIVAFLSAAKFVFFKISKILILYFHIFQTGLVVLNAILQTSEYVTILQLLCIAMCVCKFFSFLLAVELLIKIFYHLAE